MNRSRFAKRNVKALVLLGILATLLAAGCGGGKPDAEQEAERKTYPAPPPMVIDTERQYFATIHTTMGDIRLELFAGEAPKTVNNFVFLARDHFYDGIIFHRIVRDFVIQTGDPLGTGQGGPGYVFEDELPPAHPYEPGIVAMANSGPNTNGSQFFICSGPVCQALNQFPNFTVFARVVEGMDVVEEIESVPVEFNSDLQEESSPTKTVKITGIDIEEK